MSVLFKGDWSQFPRALPDYNTSNKTFLRIVGVYREMGIENCLFPLLLLQPELVGVDPHSEDLTDEQKIMIAMECEYNPWYFLREVVRIPPVAGPTAVPYKANRGNIALSWLFFNSIDVALIQPRQTGKSVSTDCVMCWYTHFGTTNTLVNMITKDNELRGKNVERIKKIRDLLPSYLIHKSRRDSDNQINITYSYKSNEYSTGVAQNSESAAGNLGRGLTSPVLHIDEGPFIRFIGITIPAALAGGTEAKAQARENGRLYGNIFTTTAGKIDDRDGGYMYNLIHNGAVWTEKFFDCDDRDHTVKLITKGSKGRKLIVNCTFSHRQLGKTDQWLYQAIADTSSTGEEADRDFLNVWTRGSSKSPLTIKQNEAIKSSEIDPLYMEITKESYIVRWYKTEAELAELMKTTSFILGLDTSDAIGQDYIGLVIIDIRDMSVIGTAVINETNLIKFSKFLSNLLIRYKNMTLIPEKRSSAQAIIDFLLIELPRAGEDPFVRIFNRIVSEKGDHEKQYHEITTTPTSRRDSNFYDKHKKYFGFNTGSSSRDLLYSTVLQNATDNTAHVVRDKSLSDEIRGLVVRNGRIDHSLGGNDDMVIAWLMTHWMIMFSKNLGFYGIDTNKTMKLVSKTGKQLSPEDVFNRDVQNKYKEEVEYLYEELKNTKSPFLISKLESRLRKLDTLIENVESDSESIDSLISLAKETRTREMRKRQNTNTSAYGRVRSNNQDTVIYL